MKYSLICFLFLYITYTGRCQDSMIGESNTRDSIFVAREDFKYADNPRYTFLGGTPRKETDMQLWPTIGMAGVYSAFFISLQIIQSDAWWKDQSGDWHVVDDVEYARGLDKFGHAYTSYVMTTLCGDLLMESGMAQEPAMLTGAGMGLVYMMFVEVQDGFAKNWGFSPTDAAANCAGVGFYVAQHYVPFLENFTPRWSYIPPEWTGNRAITDRPTTFIDDYNGTTFWLAANVNNLLPEAAKPYWPDWLMFDIGYGIRNYAVSETVNGELVPVGVSRRFLFGLDYDWVKIIPESSFGFLNYVRHWLNYVRLPGPTLEVGDDGVKFGLFDPFAIIVPL